MAFTQNQIGLAYPIDENLGGTGQSTYTVGDILVADGAVSLAKLPIGANGQVLSVNAGNVSWETPASAPVSSVFGRIGAVVAQNGDYSFSQISGTIATTQLPGGGTNGANELVQLDGSGALPALNASALTNISGTLNSSANNLNVQINGGTASANVAIINSNGLSLTGTLLKSTINGVDSNNVDVQPLISSPINGDFVFTNGSGRVVDNGYSLSTSASDISNSTIMSSYYVQLAIANQITSAKSFRGGYDASTNLYPSTGGSGSGGSIKAGDVWVVTTAGTLGGTYVDVGATILALVDVPGQTSSNWAININGVASVFGRTGIVTAQTGDYNFTQISGTAATTQGGTGLTSYLTGDILYASAANTLSKLSIGADGQVLTITSGNVSWATPASAPVTSVFGRTGVVTAQSGDYNESQISPAFNTVTVSTQSLLAGNTYYTTYAGLCTMTLPATAAAGSYIEIIAGPSGSTFRIAQNSGQNILFGALSGVSQSTTAGTGGYLQSVDPNTVIRLKCTVANTTFVVVHAINDVNGV